MATTDDTGRAYQSGPKQVTQQPAPDPATREVVELLVSILKEVKRQVVGQAPAPPPAPAPELLAELERIREALLVPRPGRPQDNSKQASGT